MKQNAIWCTTNTLKTHFNNNAPLIITTPPRSMPIVKNHSGTKVEEGSSTKLPECKGLLKDNCSQTKEGENMFSVHCVTSKEEKSGVVPLPSTINRPRKAANVAPVVTTAPAFKTAILPSLGTTRKLEAKPRQARPVGEKRRNVTSRQSGHSSSSIAATPSSFEKIGSDVPDADCDEKASLRSQGSSAYGNRPTNTSLPIPLLYLSREKGRGPEGVEKDCRKCCEGATMTASNDGRQKEKDGNKVQTVEDLVEEARQIAAAVDHSLPKKFRKSELGSKALETESLRAAGDRNQRASVKSASNINVLETDAENARGTLNAVPSTCNSGAAMIVPNNSRAEAGNEMTPCEAELIQEVLHDISDQDYEVAEMNCEGYQTYNERSDWVFMTQGKLKDEEDIYIPHLRPVTNEDIISVVGKSCLPKTEKPLDSASALPGKVSSRVVAMDNPVEDSRMIRKSVHFFCTTNVDMRMPEFCRSVWQRRHLGKKFNIVGLSESAHGNKRESLEADEHDALSLQQAAAAERILGELGQLGGDSTDALEAWRNAAHGVFSRAEARFTGQKSDAPQLSVRGTKADLVSNTTALFWTTAPPKWEIAPVEVKKVLFPEYHGAGHRAEGYEGEGMGAEDLFDEDEEKESFVRSSDVQRTLSRRHGSLNDLHAWSGLTPTWRRDLDADQDLVTDSTKDLFHSRVHHRATWRRACRQAASAGEGSATVNRAHIRYHRRPSSAPPALDPDEDALLIYQDFQFTMLELSKQKEELDARMAAQRESACSDVRDTTVVAESENVQTSRPLSRIAQALRKQAEQTRKHAARVVACYAETENGHMILPIERRSTSSQGRRRKRFSKVDEVRKQLTDAPSSGAYLMRSESLPRLAHDVRREHKVPQHVRSQRRSSIPHVLDFNMYLHGQSGFVAENAREWVRSIWNGWFDELFPPSPRPETDLHVEGSGTVNDLTQTEHRQVSDERNSTDAEGLELTPGIDDAILDEEDIELLEEEVKKLTLAIESDTTAYDLCRRGAILRKLGRIKAALDDLNQATEREPRMQDAYWHRHLIFLLLDRKPAALQDLAALLRINPAHVGARKSRAALRAAAGDLDLAVLDLSKALQQNPRDVDALYQRALLYEQSGLTQFAMADLAACRRLAPTMTAPLLKHAQHLTNACDWSGVVEELDELLEAEPGHVTARLLRGHAYSKLSQWEEAVRDFSIVIHLDPSNARAFYVRGCLLSKVNPRQALRDLSVSLLLDSGVNNNLARLQRAKLYYQTSRPVNAIADFEAALKVDPSATSALLNLGLIYLLLLNQAQRAIEQFTRAIKIDPTLVKAILCRAETYQRQNEWKRALKDVTRAIHLQPGTGQLYTWRGELVRRTGNLQLATFCVRHLAEMGCDLGHDPVQRATIQAFLGNYDKATEILETARRTAPTVPLLMLLGRTYMKACQWTAAAESLLQALSMMKEQGKPKRRDVSEANFLLGMCHIELFDLSRAATDFTDAIRADKKHANAFYWRGVSKLKLDNRKGILDVNRSLALKPTLFQAYLTRAAYYGMVGQYSKAILNCNEAIKLQPASIRGYLYRGALKYYMRSYTLAIRDLKTVISIDNSCHLAFFNRAVCHHARNDVKKALVDYGIVLLLTGDDALTLKVLINRALLYLQLADYQNALHDLLWASRLNPASVAIHHTLGVCYHRLALLREAVASFTTALQLDPFSSDALIGRGNAFMEFGHDVGFVRAKRDYGKVLHMDQKNLPARVNLAQCLQVTGRFMKAWHQFTSTISLNAKFVPALEGRAIVSLQMGDTFAAMQDLNAALNVQRTAELLTNRGVVHQFMNDGVNAMRDYQHAIQLDPHYSLAYFNAANIYFYGRHFSQALTYYDKSLEYQPNDESALLNRAITKVMLKDEAGALSDFGRAQELSPYSAHIYFNRANLHATHARYEQAEHDYSAALHITSDDPLALMRRADVRAALGRREAAIEDYRRAIEIQSHVN